MYSAMQLLEDLEQLVPCRPTDNLHEYRELLQDGVISDATARGFVVETGLGRVQVDIPGGLTAEHYARLATPLSVVEKGTLAKGVLENLLQLEPHDLDTVWRLCRQTLGLDEEYWLPDLVEEKGFDAIAEKMRSALGIYRKENPRPRIRVEIYSTPRWDRATRRLTFGKHRWPFRLNAVMVFAVLDTLEAEGWKDANALPAAYNVRGIATAADVRDAVQVIKDKTHGVLGWTACNDGLVRWWAK